MTIYTPDEFRPAYVRLVQLLETANYQVIAKDSSRMPRQHTVTLKRVSPGMPEFTLYLYLTMYHRFGATYLNISGYCRGPGRLDGHSVFYLKEDSDNKYAPILHVLWKEMEDAAASYPDGIVLYSNVL